MTLFEVHHLDLLEHLQSYFEMLVSSFKRVLQHLQSQDFFVDSFSRTLLKASLSLCAFFSKFMTAIQYEAIIKHVIVITRSSRGNHTRCFSNHTQVLQWPLLLSHLKSQKGVPCWKLLKIIWFFQRCFCHYTHLLKTSQSHRHGQCDRSWRGDRSMLPIICCKAKWGLATTSNCETNQMDIQIKGLWKQRFPL